MQARTVTLYQVEMTGTEMVTLGNILLAYKHDVHNIPGSHRTFIDDFVKVTEPLPEAGYGNGS